MSKESSTRGGDTRAQHLVKETEKRTLEARVDELERKFGLITEGFEWAANQVRPMFGQGALAVIFDGVADGLKKPKKGAQ